MEQDQDQDAQLEPLESIAGATGHIHLQDHLAAPSDTDEIVDQWVRDLHQNIPALRETCAWNTLQEASGSLKRRLQSST